MGCVLPAPRVLGRTKRTDFHWPISDNLANLNYHPVNRMKKDVKQPLTDRNGDLFNEDSHVNHPLDH